MGREGRRKDRLFNARRAISLHVALVVLTVAALSGIIIPPNTRAGDISLSAGNVTLTLGDSGVITNDVAWNMITQTSMITGSYLTIHHSAYPSGGGNAEVASGFGALVSDFTMDENNTYLEDKQVQEVHSSFTQTGVSGVSNDLKIHQNAFSKENEDWAIIMWKLENIYGQDIFDLRVGMSFKTRVNNTATNDVDHWNAGDSIYYFTDDPVGTTFMGFASANSTVPLNHYYGNPDGKQGAVDPSDDSSLYDALITNQVHGSAAPMTCMVGWEIGTLPAGSVATLPFVIAFGSDYASMAQEVAEAEKFLILRLTDVLVTEIQDAASVGTQRVEVYNNGRRTVYSSELYLSPDGVTTWTGGSWSKSSFSPGEHSVYSLGPGEAFPSLEGGSIRIYYSSGELLDSVSYGQSGKAPDPVKDESTARYWDGSSYVIDWIGDPSPTFGTHNDPESSVLWPTDVVLREVYFNTNSTNDRYIEVYYPGASSIDMTGWTIVLDSRYYIPSITLNVTRRFFVLRANDFPTGFDMDDGTLTGDNVYLYSQSGGLIDMAGWSTAHTKGKSMSRTGLPSQWGNSGFNDAWSRWCGWNFNVTPTPEIVRLDYDRSGSAYGGQSLEFNVTVIYFGSGPDYVDITFTSTLGWPVSVNDPLGNPLTDHDGDTVPDSGLMFSGDAFDFKVNVTVPLGTEAWTMDSVFVNATSSVNTNVLDTAILELTAGIAPHLAVRKSAEPIAIWLEGSSIFPQETTVTLDLMGNGTVHGIQGHQDTVFVIDNSGSMQHSDPAYQRLDAAVAYVDMMRYPDRGAIVRFRSSAELVNDHNLTSNYSQLKNDLSVGWPNSGGGTDISSGIKVATNELIENGNPKHVKIEILLTDGQHDGSGLNTLTMQEAWRAMDNGIIIFTIGLGQSAAHGLLQQIANLTGGKYYFAPTADSLKDIYYTIFKTQERVDFAGKRIDDQVEPNPMVRDVLPSYIQYVPGSFRDEHDDPLPPDVITVNPDDSTTLDWDVDKIRIDQSWIVKFEVTSTLSGHVPVGIHPDSRVNYTRWDNSSMSEAFPEVFIYVLVPTPLNPPILSIETDQSNIRLSWTVPGDNISRYIIYRSPNQRTFDFSSPLADTMIHSDGGVVPTRTSWNDTGAASSPPREYYYAVRAVNKFGFESVTSNTVGKWTKHFDSGLSTFSLPLGSLANRDIEWYASSIPNTVYIDWMDDNDHWVRHWRGDPVIRGPLMIGEGFQIYLSAASDFTFVGSPASMIRFQEGLGDSLNFRRGLTAFAVQDDVILYWKPAVGAIGYSVYRSDVRVGFHGGNLTILATVDANTTSWRDYGAIAQAANWYYMVIPIDAQWLEGSGTYSIGVLSIEFDAGHTSMGLLLKPIGTWTLDYYCESMPTVVGMAYFSDDVWRFHATEMPAGVYDPFVEQGEGYQVSVDGWPSRFTFIGF